ncbi:hypothetical protein ACOBR2_04075 [Telmatobacter bradus]|uniref:hypothetical protein n=1 Tax=Telmatobacter bradus TaxID=474953 RepID=UPI003B43B82E
MSKKSLQESFDLILDLLRARGFETVPYAAAEAVDGSVLVSKAGVATVLAPGDPVRIVLDAGLLLQGELARLLDRGYQKFFKSSCFELPATADRLQAIHGFREELKLFTGVDSLFNESLGTTSDSYQYDRIKGRETRTNPPVPH